MQNNEAKSAIFDSIRQNLTKSLSFDEVHREHQAHRETGVSATAISIEKSVENLAEIFRESLRAVGAYCEIVENKSQAILMIEQIIEEKKVKKIAVSDAVLIDELIVDLKTEAEILTRPSKEILFETDLGITSAQFGIAELCARN